ncbi:hypothetical protein [Thioalkalivibrio denitrificans]|uniref:hypothetical protein n=1 Tax=Thioalkalivibrio denitrificans TaxID=108003 RepID=UPI00111564FB|nr:hypothetical protein [Thioalkalivibrio denitrificans]
MKLRFPIEEVPYWAGRYSYPRTLNGALSSAVQTQRYFTKAQLVEICQWKSPRSAPKAERNDAVFVEEVTRAAIATTNEQFRVEGMTLLHGVGWPVASCLLHFGISGSYPILDFRALWSLNVDVQPREYCFNLWQAYVAHCQVLAEQADVSVRELDKALWQYSKEKS